MIHVTIKTLDSQNYEFDVNEEATVVEFKEIIAKKINIPSHKQRLIFKGKVLQDDKVLNSYSVQDQVIHMVERHIPSSLQNEPTNSSTIEDDNAGERTHTAQPRVFLGTVDIPLNNGNFDMTRFESALHQFAQNLTQTDFLNQGISSANGSMPNITPTSPANTYGGNVSYSKQRLDIAQKMIKETKKELKKLKSSNTTPITMEVKPLQEDLDIDKPSTSQQIHSTKEDVSTTSTGEAANLENANSNEKSPSLEPNNPTVSESGPTPTMTRARPKTADMAHLIEQYTGVVRDLLPYLDSTAQNLRMTENFNDQGEKGARAQTEFDTISRIIHYLSHAQHAMSDIVVDFNQAGPRYLRAAVLHQAYVPVEVTMPFNVAMPVHNLPQPNPNLTDQGTVSDAPNTTHQMDISSASTAQPPASALDSRPRSMTVIVESRNMGSTPVPITTFTTDLASSMASSLAGLVGGQELANGDNLAAHVEFRVEQQQPDQDQGPAPDQAPQANPLLNAALGANLTPTQLGSGGHPNSLPTTSAAPTMSSYLGDDGSINISMAFPLPPNVATLTPRSQTSTTPASPTMSSTLPSNSASWSTQMAGTMRNLLSSIMPRFSNSAIPNRNGDTTSTTHSSNSSNRSRSVPRLSPRNRQSEAPFNQHIPFVPPFLEGMLNQHLNFVPTNNGSSSGAPGMGGNGPPNFLISYQQAGQGPPSSTYVNGPSTLNPGPGSMFSASNVDPLFSHNDPLLPCLSHHFVNLSPGSNDRIGFINVQPNHNGRFDWSRINNPRSAPRRAPRNGVGVARPILRVSRNRTVPPPRNSRNSARPTRNVETVEQTAARETRSQVIPDQAPPTSSPTPQLVDIMTSMFERMVNPEATATSEFSSHEGTDISGLLRELFGGSNSSPPSADPMSSGAMFNFLGALVGQFMIPPVTSNGNDRSTIQDGIGSDGPNGLTNLPPGSSIYDFLSNYTDLFPELLENEGQTDLISRFMLFAFQRTNFATLQGIFLRQPQALNHLNRLIVAFVLAQRPSTETLGQSTWPDKAELTDVVERICRETLPFSEEIFRDIPTRDDINIVPTIDAYQSCTFTTLLAAVFNQPPSSTAASAGFSGPEDVIDLLCTAERHLISLLRRALANPTRDIPVIVRRALTSSLWTGNNFASIFGGGPPGSSANFVTDLLSRWLVSYLMPNPSQPTLTLVETDFLPYFYRFHSPIGVSEIDEKSLAPPGLNEAVDSTSSSVSNLQDKRKIARMEIEEDENFQDALGYQDNNVSSRSDENAKIAISGETEKDWKAQIPNEWGPIIENDMETQKNESSSTTTNAVQGSSNRVDNVAITQARNFSNAYIAGMPSKRRKMMEAAQSTRLASPYLDEYLREVLDKALSDAGVFITLDEFEEIIEGMMLDQNLIGAFHAMLASKMDMAIQSTDFSPAKFPDILKYIRKYLP